MTMADKPFANSRKGANLSDLMAKVKSMEFVPDER
jgi:hypothetical protein